MFTAASIADSCVPFAIRSPRHPAAAGLHATNDASTTTVRHWLAAALDELDYGIVLLGEDMRIVHINDAARDELDDQHPLQRVGGELRARLGRDIHPLHDALTSAATRGLRRLLPLGEVGHRISVSVVPLEASGHGGRAVLVVIGKRAVCESLSIQGFARANALTGAETRVLVALCGGVPPTRAAEQLGVAVSTVRSQIQSIRAKTGSESIRALVRQIAVLPPVKGVLRHCGVARDPLPAPAA